MSKIKPKIMCTKNNKNYHPMKVIDRDTSTPS